MKKLTYLIALIFILPLLANGQGKFSSIIDKYQGVKGFTTVNMTSDMFETLGDMSKKELPKGIEGMIILTFDRDEADKDYPLYSELKAIIDKEDYKTFMDVNDGDERVHFLVKKDNKSKNISEFLMLITEPDETTFIWMGGNLNMDDIQKMNNIDDMFEVDDDEDDDDDDDDDAHKGGKIK